MVTIISASSSTVNDILILSQERSRQVDVVGGVGEEGLLKHHFIIVEQLNSAVGVVVVEVEGVALQCHVGAVGGKVRLVRPPMHPEIINSDKELEMQSYSLCHYWYGTQAEKTRHDGCHDVSPDVFKSIGTHNQCIL
jgi:hypothetical protein